MEKLYILLILTASFSLINCAPFSNTGNSTDEFENSYVGILISPILSPEISREIEIYWSHTKIRPGDKIGLFFEEPRDDLKPVFIMEPTSPIGIAKTGIEADFIPSSNLTFTKQCLKYHVAWLRTGMVRKENCLKTEPTWMADMRCILGSQRMRDIFLPGTHDSSAYTKTDLLLPETLVTKYAITQDEDILGQLIYGARYLDIRVGYYATEEIQWWGSHGLVAVVPFQTVVEDVKTFLDNTDEIVIFDVQEFPVGFGKDFAIHRKLVAFLEEQFADYIIPKSFGWSSTLETIWSSGKRLIIGYDEQNVVGMYDSLWPSVYQQWGNVQKVDDLYEYLNKIETNALSSLKVNPRSAMAELTPKAWDIFLDRLGGLRKMAEEVDAKITMWYNTKWQLSANIVSVDFIKATGIVEAAHFIRRRLLLVLLFLCRLRSSICGYTESSLKVCCDPLARSVDAISDPESSPYPVWNLQCGQTLIKSNVETLGSYPFVVLVSFVNTANRAVIYPCLGTIINERSILTTATCALANYANFQLHSVVVGDFDISMDPDCNALFCSHKARHYPISYVIKYPSFESITYTNNIALLRLTTSIEFTVTAQPICLPPAEFIVREGKSGTVVGWGKLSFQRDMSSIQQILRMKLMPLQECSQYTKRGLSVELCARGEEPCSGFSGAPFFSREGDNYFLIGIVSHGSDCEDQQSDPTVFVDVQKYTDWIRNNF